MSGRATERMATPIGSPRVPSTVSSSLVMPAARDDVEPDDSAHAARCASHASLARSANASLLASPAEDDQSALLHVPLLPCTASATPGTMNADTRALPALLAFSASAASASHHSSLPTDSFPCPLSLRGDPEGALFGSGPDVVASLDAAVASMATMPVFHPHIPSAYGVARSLLMSFQSMKIVQRNRGMGAMSFEQMVFKEEDLQDPQPEEWPDMIAQSPLQVIQSMRLAITNNTVARVTREDIKLPPASSWKGECQRFANQALIRYRALWV